MDWHRVRKVNRRASARKAKREAAASAAKAMHDRLGGPVKVDELKSGKWETRECYDTFYQRPFSCEVVTFRGREWAFTAIDDDSPFLVPHNPRRESADLRGDWIPLTAGAKKWYIARRTNDAA